MAEGVQLVNFMGMDREYWVDPRHFVGLTADDEECWVYFEQMRAQVAKEHLPVILESIRLYLGGLDIVVIDPPDPAPSA